MVLLYLGAVVPQVLSLQSGSAYHPDFAKAVPTSPASILSCNASIANAFDPNPSPVSVIVIDWPSDRALSDIPVIAPND